MRNATRSTRAPSFSGFRPASPESSRAKQANRPRDTLAELGLRRALWKLGLRYRTHWRGLPGRPDVVFPKARLAIFCDGDFWHGRNWRQLSASLQRHANASYWIAKIAANRARDGRTRRALHRLGWQVVKVWEGEIRNDPDSIALQVKRTLDARLRLLGQANQAARPRLQTRRTTRKGRTA